MANISGPWDKDKKLSGPWDTDALDTVTAQSDDSKYLPPDTTMPGDVTANREKEKSPDGLLDIVETIAKKGVAAAKDPVGVGRGALGALDKFNRTVINPTIPEVRNIYGNERDDKFLGKATRDLRQQGYTFEDKKRGLLLDPAGKPAKVLYDEKTNQYVPEKTYWQSRQPTTPGGQVGEFLGNVGIGSIGGGQVPAVGGTGALAKLATGLGQGAVANVPFVAKAQREGGWKEAGKEIALNTLFDLMLAGASGGKRMVQNILDEKALRKAATRGVDIIAKQGLIDPAQKAAAKMSLMDYLQAAVGGGEFSKAGQEAFEKTARVGPLGSTTESAAKVLGAAEAGIDFASKAKTPGAIKRWLSDLNLPEADWDIMAKEIGEGEIPFPEYAIQAVKKQLRHDALGADELASIPLKKELEKIDKIRRQAGAQIDKVVKSNADKTVNISDIKREYLEMVQDRIGGEWAMAEDGLKLVDTPANIISDVEAAQRAQDIATDLSKLPDELPAQSAHRLKQRMESKSKYVDQLGRSVPHPVLNGINKTAAAEVSDRLKRVLPKDYAIANKTYGNVKQLEDRMSRLMGQEFNPELGLSKHGAHLMKRAIENPGAGDVRDVFRQVQELTGKNLFQDAIYANLAQRLVGDPRQLRSAMTLTEAVRGGRGGLVERGIDLSGRAVKATQKGPLQELVDWYTKQHGIRPVDLDRVARGAAPQTLEDFLSEAAKSMKEQ